MPRVTFSLADSLQKNTHSSTSLLLKKDICVVGFRDHQNSLLRNTYVIRINWTKRDLKEVSLEIKNVQDSEKKIREKKRKKGLLSKKKRPTWLKEERYLSWPPFWISKQGKKKKCSKYTVSRKKGLLLFLLICQINSFLLLASFPYTHSTYSHGQELFYNSVKQLLSMTLLRCLCIC